MASQGETQPITEQTQPTPAPVIYSLNILKTIKESQIQNGLRHSDYARYRSYCGRRLRRVRKSLKFLHGHKFQRKKIDPNAVNNPRYLELTLFMSERAWAHAMQLKEDTENFRNKFTSLRRLNKASKWAGLLLDICNLKADERTKLEAESYYSWLKGSVLMEKEDWKTARELLVKAKTVYEELGKVSSLVDQEICKERVSEIEPTIRYCNFSLTQSGQEQDHDQLVKMIAEADNTLKNKLDTVLSDIRKKEAQSMNEISWRGQRIPIRVENLRVAILSINDAKFELEQSPTVEQKLQFYQKLFMHYDDALKIIESESKSKQSKKQSELQELSSISDYISFQKIQSFMQRNTMLVEDLEAKLNNNQESTQGGKTPKEEEVVRLYELMIENVTELISHVEDDEKLRKELAAKLLSFKALRCYNLALTYSNAGKYAESLSLFNKARAELKDALSHHQQCNNEDTALVSKLLATEKKVLGKQSSIHAQAFLESLKKSEEKTETKVQTSSGGLMDMLGEYDASFIDNGKIIDFPPKLEAIACKPILFDLALSSMKFPDLEERKKAPRTGFFSSLWGGR